MRRSHGSTARGDAARGLSQCPRRLQHRHEPTVAVERVDTTETAVVAPADELATDKKRRDARASGQLGELSAKGVTALDLVELDY